MLQALSRLSPDSFLGALVRLPLRMIPGASVVRVRGGLNRGASWIAGSATHGCWLGTYESDKQQLVSKLVRPGMVVWDVGANAGFYTLAFSRLVGDRGRVYAFEPLAQNANHVLQHVRLNALGNVALVQAALSAETGMLGFHIAERQEMGHLDPNERSYLVPTTSIDAFLARFPESRPDLLKIDVEGAEGELLAGGAEFLRAAGPDIVLALHGEAATRRSVELLHAYGYSLFHLDGSPADAPRTDEIYARKGSARA